jgi:ribose 5-phosphate isomerase RpiB
MEIMAQRKSDDANGVIYAICDTKEQARLARTMHSANLLCISKFDLGEIDKIYRAFLGIDE